MLSLSLLVCPFATGASRALISTAVPYADLQITFEPSIPTLELRTEVPGIIATGVAAGGLEQFEGGQLPTYRRVNCEAIKDTVCFDLCYAGRCFTYGDDDERVQRFIEQVDDMREQFDKLELARIKAGSNTWGTIKTCLTSLGAGFGAAGVIAGLVVALEPTGILKAIAIGAAALSALGRGAGCVSDIVGGGTDAEMREDLERDFGRAANEAAFEFEDLLRDPPEE
jgi:hypothetical protein